MQEIYVERGWAAHAWVWHEAADTSVFRPRDGVPADGDVVWIGNWGDEERSAELFEFLVEPVRALGASGNVYGVRYPDHAIASLEDAGILHDDALACALRENGLARIHERHTCAHRVDQLLDIHASLTRVTHARTRVRSESGTTSELFV